jgi:hypothetical protein
MQFHDHSPAIIGETAHFIAPWMLCNHVASALQSLNWILRWLSMYIQAVFIHNAHYGQALMKLSQSNDYGDCGFSLPSLAFSQ